MDNELFHQAYSHLEANNFSASVMLFREAVLKTAPTAMQLVNMGIAKAQEFRIPAGAGMMFPEGDSRDGFVESG